ncbi:MAG: MBL fold metallo-hydrolase [Anaerolineae bacterium]|nr:MBL fold metallo-hydrolase [Anaerolineae bacterium]
MLDSNTYLIVDETTGAGAIVDPGGKTGPLFAAIESHEVEVKYLLNTHGHFDHVAANAHLKARFPVPLGLHAADASLLSSGGGATWFGSSASPSPPPDLLLENRMRLPLGALEIVVIHAPGHTPGSVCFYIPQENALLTGDTLFKGSVGRTDLPGGNTRQLTESLRALQELPPDTQIYPGHGAATTLRAELRYNPWLRRLRPQSTTNDAR